jgi:hypothetical protein
MNGMALVSIANSNNRTRERRIAFPITYGSENALLDACRSAWHPKNYFGNNKLIVTKYYLQACCCLSHSAMLANGNTCIFGVTA